MSVGRDSLFRMTTSPFMSLTPDFYTGENCIRAYRELAAHHGAEFSMNNPVVDIEAYERRC